MLCEYILLKGCNTGIPEYINLEYLGNDNEDDQTRNICMVPIPLQLPQLLLPH